MTQRTFNGRLIEISFEFSTVGGSLKISGSARDYKKKGRRVSPRSAKVRLQLARNFPRAAVAAQLARNFLQEFASRTGVRTKFNSNRCSTNWRVRGRERGRELVESARAVTKNIGNDVHVAGNLFPETRNIGLIACPTRAFHFTHYEGHARATGILRDRSVCAPASSR